MSRLWLTFMAGPGSLDDLREMVDPIKDHFDGVCATYFGSIDDAEAQYLESIKGVGHITYLPYTGRHDLARTCAVHCGKIEDGDIVCQFDTLERVPTEFATRIRELMTAMDSVDAFFYYGKIFLYRYHESVTFRGTPHEGWTYQHRQPVALELSKAYPDESQVRLNVRPLKRKDPLSWCLHYLRYYLVTPWGANHCLLGNEHRGDPVKLYQEREAIRIPFREYLRSKDVALTVDGFKAFVLKNPKDAMLIEAADKERILNDVYRLWVLKDYSIVDDHSWNDMIIFNKDEFG